MSADALCHEAGRMPESSGPLSRDARGEADCANVTVRTDKLLRSAICDAMLKILSRDSELRRTYVRRRWQGLAEQNWLRLACNRPRYLRLRRSDIVHKIRRKQGHALHQRYFNPARFPYQWNSQQHRRTKSG